MVSSNFKHKIILLTVVPVFLVSMIITGLSIYKLTKLGQINSQDFADKILELRRNELKNYTQLALTAVNHVYSNTEASEKANQHMAKQVFRDLRYGRDGYFFVYDYEGKNLTHPMKPYLEGQNLWNLQDPNGTYMIQGLIRQAKGDLGGYTEYVWEKPSESRLVNKLGFSMGLNRWRWMIGTGLYMDDIDKALLSIQKNVEENSRQMTVITLVISLFVTAIVAFLVIRLSVSQRDFANTKLQKLSRSCVEEREVEREMIAHQLKEDVAVNLQPASEILKKIAGLDSTADSVKDRLLVAAANLDDSGSAVKQIVDTLHPEVLVEHGLYIAVEELADRLSQETGVRMEVKSVSRMERPVLNIETACYRIVNEALMNIINHSKASDASIRFRQTQSMLSITIQDNGIGFDVHGKGDAIYDSGVGLADMQLQAELYNGSLTVFSTKGTGTMVKLSIPLATILDLDVPVLPSRF